MMKKIIAISFAVILAISAVLAASSRLYFHTIIWDDVVKEDQVNELFITTEYDWNKQTELVEEVVEMTDELGNAVEETKLVEKIIPGNPSDLKDVAVKVFVPELGIYMTTVEFDQDDDIQTHGILLDMAGAEPGEYTLKVTMSNDDVKRTRHRFFVIG